MSLLSLATPIGPVTLQADSDRLTAIRIGSAAADDEPAPVLEEARRQIEAWFAGRITRFDLPLAPPVSPRGPALREAIVAIEHGDTASYGEVARRIGSSPRAVGQACARNPFPLVVPCHRVVGAGQAIGHYSSGKGIATKRWLLAFEARRSGLWAA